MNYITNHGISVRVSMDLPYTPYQDEIIYVDGVHTIKVEKWRIEYYKDFIGEILNVPKGYAEGYGELIVTMLQRPEFWEYFSDEARHDIESEMVDRFDFKQYILSKEIAESLRPSLFIYDEKFVGYHYFKQFEISSDGLLTTLNYVLQYMDERDRSGAYDYDLLAECDTNRHNIIRALEYRFAEMDSYICQCCESLLIEKKKLLEKGIPIDDEIDKILAGLSDKIKELEHDVMNHEMGLLKFDLQDPRRRDMSSKTTGLHVTKRGKFFLTVDGVVTEQEIRLSPLDKAVYLLFLRHEEGINFSYLPDHRDELLEIYRSLMNYRTSAAMRKSIDDVTDPTNNSINEKCARIRRAFISELGQPSANPFLIAGPRGEAKRIAIDRRLVTQED